MKMIFVFPLVDLTAISIVLSDNFYYSIVENILKNPMYY